MFTITRRASSATLVGKTACDRLFSQKQQLLLLLVVLLLVATNPPNTKVTVIFLDQRRQTNSVSSAISIESLARQPLSAAAQQPDVVAGGCCCSDLSDPLSVGHLDLCRPSLSCLYLSLALPCLSLIDEAALHSLWWAVGPDV